MKPVFRRAALTLLTLLLSLFQLTAVGQPAAPGALNASTLSTNSLLLNWTDNSSNETGFQIERSLSAGSGFSLIATTAANATSYISTGLGSGTQYFYRIRSTSGAGQSAYTTVATATTGLKRFLLDFGAPTVTTTASGWNNITAPTTGSVTNLVDVTGAASPLTFTIVKDPSNGYAPNNTNGAPQAVLDYPQSAASDSHFCYQSGGSYRLNGLDNSKAYSIRIFSSRMYVGDSRKGTFTINGQSLSIEGMANTTQTIQFTNLTPVSGALTINFTLASGAYYAYINVMDIVENSVIPQTPSNLTATAASPTQINLTWNDVSGSETGFQIERSLTAGSGFELLTTTAANATAFQDLNLTENTRYYYRVRAINALGNSAYTPEVSALTPIPAPAPPQDLVAEVVSATEIALSWTDASSNEAGFQIERSSNALSGFVLIATRTESSFSNTGLTPGTQYFYRVRAVNSGGSSAYSTVISALTVQVPPNAPTSLTATAVSISQINLTWVSNAGSFEVERKTGTADFELIATTSQTSYSNSGLDFGTRYTYRVRATNSAGPSAYTAEISATTPIPPPAAPQDLVADFVSATEIALSWTDASDNEAGFQIERSLNAVSGFALIATQAESLFANASLTPGTQYFYRVRAFNSGGNSAYVTVNATTLQVPPVAPTSLTAAAVSMSQINLTWISNAGSFEIERKTGTADFELIATTSQPSYANSGLSFGIQYTYRVRAINSAGPSVYTSEASATTPAPQPPAAPTNLVAAPLSLTQIHLVWTDNSNDEDGFILQLDTVNVILPPNITTYTYGGLTPGTQYSYSLKAFNGVGNSGNAMASAATLAPQPPTAPNGLSAAATSQTQINLAWTDRSNDETSFQIERSSTSTNGFTLLAEVNATNYSDVNLTASTQYFYRVKAINAIGSSAYTAEANATTQSLTQPYGTIFSETSFASTTRFPIAGTGITRGTNKLTTSGNPTLFASYVYLNDPENPFRYTCLENWKMRVRVKTPTSLNSTTYGIGLGVRSTNTFDPYSTSMRWSWDTGDNKVYLYYKTSITNQIVSSTKFTPAANTFYWVEVTRNKDAFTYKVFDGATGGTQLFSVTLTFPTFTSGNYIKAHNTGQFCLYQFGGANEITNWDVSTSALMNADYAGVGDSNMHGMFTNNNSTRFIESAMTQAGKSFNILAGIADRSSDVVQRLPEIVALRPKAVVLSIGRNDLANSVSLSTVQSNINTIINTLQNAGIEVKLAGVIASNVNVSALQTFYNGKPNQQVNAYLATKAASSTALNTTLSSGDQIHLNRAGNTALTDLLLTILIPQVPTPPNVPTGLLASVASSSQIDLTWTDGSANETGFQVERSSTAGSGFALIATVPANSAAYSDAGLTNNTRYYYRIRSVNSVGVSPYTSEVNATTSANAADPTGLNVSVLSTAGLLLTWTDNSNNETGFQIERSLSSESGFALVGTAAANTTTFMNTGLLSGTQYYYRVRASNAGGFSGYSASASAKTGVRRFLLDFGAPTILTTATGWNNITAPATGSITNLLDAAGTASAVTFTIVKDPSNGYAANNTNGPSQTVLDYPASAASDSHFGWQTGGSYRISGLENTRTYSIRIFSSRMFVSDSRKGQFTINGQQLTLEGMGNTSQTIQFVNIAPTSGAINISFAPATGASFAYINVMDIVENEVLSAARMAADPELVSEVLIEPGFETYPNPVINNLTVIVKNSDANALFKVHDMLGREVLNAVLKTNQDNIIELGSLASGVYLVTVTSGDNKYSRVILKQD